MSTRCDLHIGNEYVDCRACYNALEVERDHYRAALQKMFIEGAGKPCVCGCCYVCIAKDALSRYPNSVKPEGK